MTADLFERARAVSALDVARHAGLPLQQKGRRWWTCCPIRREKTASLMIDEWGNWHCFGCNRGGDGIALYAAMHGLTQGQAARELVNEHAPTRTVGPSVQSVLRDVSQWKASELKRLYDRLKACRARMDAVMQGVSPDAAFPPEFVKAAQAQTMLLQLIADVEGASAAELYRVMKGGNASGKLVLTGSPGN